MVKRTINDAGLEASADAPQTPADMAELLRAKLIAKYESMRKKRRVSKRRTINVNDLDPVSSDSLFFKLDREVRDMIYQILWADTPQIKQRYKRQYYRVTYGDLDASKPRANGKAPWLLASKQILLEGLAEFHQRSVWHFETSSSYRPTEYIFPLITPALVREHHLTIAASKYPSPGVFNSSCPFDMLEYVAENEEGTEEVGYNLVPKSKTMALINLMTASAEEHDAVAKIKVNMLIEGNAFRARGITHGGLLYAPFFKFDLSRFDRLAVHRRLRIFEVEVVVRPTGASGHRLQDAIGNLVTEVDIVGKALIPDGKSVQRFLIKDGSGSRASSRNSYVSWRSLDLVLQSGRPG